MQQLILYLNFLILFLLLFEGEASEATVPVIFQVWEICFCSPFVICREASRVFPRQAKGDNSPPGPFFPQVGVVIGCCLYYKKAEAPQSPQQSITVVRE